MREGRASSLKTMSCHELVAFHLQRIIIVVLNWPPEPPLQSPTLSQHSTLANAFSFRLLCKPSFSPTHALTPTYAHDSRLSTNPVFVLSFDLTMTETTRFTLLNLSLSLSPISNISCTKEDEPEIEIETTHAPILFYRSNNELVFVVVAYPSRHRHRTPPYFTSFRVCHASFIIVDVIYPLQSQAFIRRTLGLSSFLSSPASSFLPSPRHSTSTSTSISAATIPRLTRPPSFIINFYSMRTDILHLFLLFSFSFLFFHPPTTHTRTYTHIYIHTRA